MSSGRRSIHEAMAAYQSARDTQVLPLYGFTMDMATLAPHRRRRCSGCSVPCAGTSTMDLFVGINAGSVDRLNFFDPANIGRLLAPV